MQEAAALDQPALQQRRRHQAGGRTPAQVAEGVAVWSVLHEIQAGMGVVIALHARGIHPFGFPQIQELRAEGVVADPR
ncbi:hypothetical protein D3C84_1218380 [compost metagenome]